MSRRRHHQRLVELRKAKLAPVQPVQTQTSRELALKTLADIGKAHGMLAAPEITALMLAASELPDNAVAAVLGSGPGTATVAILLAKPDVFVYSVDIADAPTESYHAKRLGYSPRLRQIVGNSGEVAWDGPQLDLLFVDACHAYACVKRDNQVWLPRLKSGGIVWYHDYGTEDSMWLEVKRAVDEDMANQEQIVHTCCSIAFRWNPNQLRS